MIGSDGDPHGRLPRRCAAGIRQPLIENIAGLRRRRLCGSPRGSVPDGGRGRSKGAHHDASGSSSPCCSSAAPLARPAAISRPMRRARSRRASTCSRRRPNIGAPSPATSRSSSKATASWSSTAALPARTGGAPSHFIRSITRKPVKALLYTHWHNDHPQGGSEIRAAWPRVRIISTAGDAAHAARRRMPRYVSLRPDERIETIFLNQSAGHARLRRRAASQSAA